jgi:hypothetical protein
MATANAKIVPECGKVRDRISSPAIVHPLAVRLQDDKLRGSVRPFQTLRAGNLQPYVA